MKGNSGGSSTNSHAHPGFGSSGFTHTWSGDPNETFKMFFGNSNPFGGFFDSDDDQHANGGFGGAGGAFPGIFRFPGSNFGPGSTHMGGSAQSSSKVINF